MRFTQNGGHPHESTCNCTHICICSLPLVHRPKGVLLGDTGMSTYEITSFSCIINESTPSIFGAINDGPKVIFK